MTEATCPPFSQNFSLIAYDVFIIIKTTLARKYTSILYYTCGRKKFLPKTPLINKD